MKTTRDTLLVVFVSFISITRLARCGASTILDDRDKETEEIEELVRKEVFSSLQFLSEDEDDDFESSYPKPIRNGNQDSGRYYQLSNQSPGKAQVSGNSYNIPEYSSSSSYYGGPSKPFNNQEVRTNGGSKTGRSIDVPSPAVSSMNTREPDDYSTTITLPSLGGGRLFYGGGGYGGGAGYSGGGGAGYSGGGDYGGSGIYNGLAGTARRMRPSALLRRGVRRLGRYGSGLAGGNGFRYGLGTGGLTGLLGGAGLQGANLGFGGGAGRAGGGGSGGGYYADYSGDGVNLSGGGGRRGYNGNARYGLQGDTSGSGGSWSVGGGSDGAPSEYYNFRYGYPGSSATVDGNSGGGGSRRYTVSYPNDATGNTVSTADGVNPQQYELMFLRNQQQNGSNQDADLQLNAGSSGANRDTSSNGAGYRLNVSGSPSTTTSNPGGVEEYRVVVVNKDSPGNGSGRSGVSMSSTGSAPGGSGSGSWSMSSSGSSGGSGSGGRTGQGGFQLTTPITSTQVSIPPTSIVGSVLSTVQGAATGEQTRSLGVSNNPPAGKFIQVIPLKNV